jgi:hypothetical protein
MAEHHHQWCLVAIPVPWLKRLVSILYFIDVVGEIALYIICQFYVTSISRHYTFLAMRIEAVKSCYFEGQARFLGKGRSQLLQLGFLDAAIYWTNDASGVTLQAAPMKTVPNMSVSDHMPVR